MTDSQQQLEDLLAQSPDSVADRVLKKLEWFKENTTSFVLYGAGTLGCAVREKLRELAIEPLAFADDTPEKQGALIAGLPVMSPGQVVERFGSDTAFVVTILNPQLSFIHAQKRLQKITEAPVISFLSLAHKYPDVLLPYYQFEKPTSLLSKASTIRDGFKLWSDEESRRQFVAHIKFRLDLDHEYLPANSPESYFATDVLPSLPDDTIFVDCGAYDGDSIREFLLRQEDRFARIYALEPDPNNFERLVEYVISLDSSVAGKIELINAGVGKERKRVPFKATGNMSAAFSANGSCSVEVIPLDEVVAERGNTVFLKFDVEGAESEALAGATKLFAQQKPFVAISVYHRPSDLWQIPLELKTLVPDYKLYLRTHGEDGMDVICYAVPTRI